MKDELTPNQKRDVAIEFINYISRSGAAPAYIWEQMRLGARLWCVELGGTDDLGDLKEQMETIVSKST